MTDWIDSKIGDLVKEVEILKAKLKVIEKVLKVKGIKLDDETVIMLKKIV